MSNNADLQIYSIIAQMEEILETSQKPKIGAGNKRLVGYDDMIDLISDLKVTIPEDIRRANKVIVDSQNMLDSAEEHARDVVSEAEQRAEATVAEANAAAERIMAKAKAEYERMLSEDEIYLEAQRRAKLLAMKAEGNANMVYENAKVYADQVLQSLENILGEYKQLVSVNRRDLDIKADKLNPVIDTGAREADAMPLAQEMMQDVPGAQQAPVMQHARQPQPEQRREAVKPKPQQPRPAKRQQPQPVEEEPVEEESFDDEFDDDFGEEKKGGGLFGWLKRGKKNDEEVFEDDDLQQ